MPNAPDSSRGIEHVRAASEGDAADAVLADGDANVRQCDARKPDGKPCRMRPLRGSRLCFAHDPEHATEAAEAHLLGGQRRRRERRTAGTYGVKGVATLEDIRRVLETAILDALELENSFQRERVLIAGSGVLLKVLALSAWEAPA